MPTSEQVVFRALSKLIDEMDEDREAIKLAASNLRSLIDKQSTSQREHQDKIKHDISESLKSAVKESMSNLQSGFSKANSTALAAAQVYQSHSKTAFWQIFFTQFIIFMMFMLFIIFFFASYFPDPEQIRSLKAEESRLTKNIDEYKKYRDAHYFTNCGSKELGYQRRCIRIDPDETTYTRTGFEEEAYSVIYQSKKVPYKN